MVYGESDTSDSLDSLPDAVVLLILDCVADAKTLTLCAAVSRRLNSLLHHVHTVVLKLDPTPSTHSNTFSRLCRRVFKNPDQTVECHPVDRGNNATPLKNFDEVRFLRIEPPRPELELENGSLVKQSATFGSALENCVVLAATSVIRPDYTDVSTGEYDNSPRTIPENRTVMPDLEMKMWYAGRVEVGDGSVLTGVTLGAIRPKEKMGLGKEFLDGDWVMSAFDEPFARLAKGMVKGRSYNVDMDLF